MVSNSFSSQSFLARILYMTDTIGGHVHDGATYGGVWVGVYLAVHQRSVMGPGTCGTRCKQWMKCSGVARTFPLGEGGGRGMVFQLRKGTQKAWDFHSKS